MSASSLTTEPTLMWERHSGRGLVHRGMSSVPWTCVIRFDVRLVVIRVHRAGHLPRCPWGGIINLDYRRRQVSCHYRSHVRFYPIPLWIPTPEVPLPGMPA